MLASVRVVLKEHDSVYLKMYREHSGLLTPTPVLDTILFFIQKNKTTRTDNLTP